MKNTMFVSEVSRSSAVLTELKDEFHSWCGLLSIEEIISNTELIRVIERLERMLLAAGA